MIFFEFFLNSYSGELFFFNPSNNTYSNVLIKTLLSTPSLLSPLIFFISVQIGLHLFFVLYSYYFQKYIHQILYTKQRNIALNFFIVLLINYLLILIINNEYYPNSKFAFNNYITNPYVLNFLENKYVYLFSILWLYLGIIFCGLYFLNKYITSRKQMLAILITSLLVILFFNYQAYLPKINNFHNSRTAPLIAREHNEIKPNIILFTIDSVRKDSIDKIQSTNNSSLDIPTFFQNAVSFNRAYTPQARSFPAMYSILSGNYPKTGNIRFNLVDQSNINFEKLLPSILKNYGYQTFYSTDSSQFHIINKNWGYTHLATPKPGIYEHIMPIINDLPLSNLIINFSISEYLFPFDYSNVAAKNTYLPSTYTKRIFNVLNTLDHSQPLFLHFNFEAAHWPYQNRDIDKTLSLRQRYFACLDIMNNQVNQVFQYLHNNNLLSNSLVIITSDHGEALSLSNDKLTNINNYLGNSNYLHYLSKAPIDYTFEELKNKNIIDVILDINTSGGHGVDVLSNSQYQVATSIQRYINNKPVFIPHVDNHLILLTDLYPTILDLLNVTHKDSKDSLSLVSFLDSQNKTDDSKFANRIIFLETDLQTPYYSPEDLNKGDVLSNFINTWSKYYMINKQQYLQLTTSAISPLLTTKQYAVINSNQEILAYIPDGPSLQWEIFKNSKNDQFDRSNKLGHITTQNCITPRVIKDSNNLLLGILCNKYTYEPGYYVYYNGKAATWELYPSVKAFKNKPSAYKLYSDLKKNYNNELGPLKADRTA